ncbi:RNA polymerase sigma factor [Tundrisphaera sp. TA3]|uniref:RNA polymerase sigma factor n=1 Tax=Tundrisphaera sp. TA3 TaxID=3435775 RepID=UPI003EBA2D19
MADTVFASTSLTLLGRLREAPRDEAAWAEFVQGYAPAISRWCRAWGLQPADVEDVTQVVLLKLARSMATFRYDPSRSFRAYLKTLTGYAARDALAEIRDRPTTGLGTEMAAWLAIEDTGLDLARWIEREMRGELFREASLKVSGRVDAHTWEAFMLTAMERIPGREVAERLGMTVDAVYMAKSRVVRMMRGEVRRLSGPMSDALA